jgi:hypothetical protein
MREFRVSVCPAEYSHIMEAAQVRTEEAVNRHLRLSCVAQSLLQRAPVVASSVEKFAFAQGQITLGQRCRVIAREVFHALLQVAQRLFTDGRSCEQVLEVLTLQRHLIRSRMCLYARAR